MAPTVGFWIYRHGWWWLCVESAVLNILMARHRVACCRRSRFRRTPRPSLREALLEWRVLVLSVTLFLYSFGYGGITSFTALYADANRRQAEEPST